MTTSPDNNISFEFDPFGFTMKEFSKGTPLMRCNSSGDLYPLSTTMLRQLTSPSTLVALYQDLWHHRLGHPGAATSHTQTTNEQPIFEPNIKQPSPVSPSTPTPQSSNSPIRPTSHTNSPSSQPVTSISRPTSQTSLLRSRPNSIHIRSPTVARAINPSRPLHISQTTQTPRPPTALVRTIHTRSMSGITKSKTPFNFSASTSLSPIPHNPKDALSDTSDGARIFHLGGPKQVQKNLRNVNV
ncbi:hypothetical protein Tco_0825519 [Tanacetum coccineum]